MNHQQQQNRLKRKWTMIRTSDRCVCRCISVCIQATSNTHGLFYLVVFLLVHTINCECVCVCACVAILLFLFIPHWVCVSSGIVLPNSNTHFSMAEIFECAWDDCTFFLRISSLSLFYSFRFTPNIKILCTSWRVYVFPPECFVYHSMLNTKTFSFYVCLYASIYSKAILCFGDRFFSSYFCCCSVSCALRWAGDLGNWEHDVCECVEEGNGIS